jgi:flagella basal body P-ring formation protein FlgA
MLTDPPIVERGERVVIEIRRGDVYVTAQGEARASAAVGETIPVKNYVSDKTIMARVVRPGAVTVE